MNLEHITQEVIRITGGVADFIRQESLQFDRSKVELKGKNDLVSYVDKSAEKLLVEQLFTLLPEAGFLTEEKTIDQTDKKLQWVVDPLDGTTNFIHGIPTYSISIALTQDHHPIIGVVYEINRQEIFSGWTNGGAWLNDTPIRISPVASIDEGLFLTGFPIQDFGKKGNYLKIISELMERSHGLRRMGSAAVDLCYVACGRSEGYFECNLSPWDVAAGALIVREAGGTVSDFRGGDDFIYGKEIVASGGVHLELLEVIKKYWF